MLVVGVLSSGVQSIRRLRYWMAPPNAVSQKAVVQVLMPLLRVERRDVQGRNGVRRDVRHNIFKCPKGEDCVKNSMGEYDCQAEGGYTNPFRHLLKCYAGSNHECLMEKYREKLAERQGRVDDFLAPSSERIAINPKEMAMHDYIRFIVENNQPLTIVEQPSFRKLSKYDYVVSAKGIRNLMYKLVEVIERSIAEEMKKCTGALMYDGWTDRSGTHFVGTFGVYMRQVVNQGSVGQEFSEVCSPLLSCSPMAHVKTTGDNEKSDFDAEMSHEEATTFDARTHVEHFKDVFTNFYGLDVCKWAVCQVADNCSTNKKVAQLLKIPHVGCNNHKLNNEVERMVRSNEDLSTTIDDVRATMFDFKTKLRCRAALRNLTTLNPIIYNRTRWSGKYHTLRRFLQLREIMIEAANSSEVPIRIKRSQAFKLKVEKYVKQLREINVVTVELQKRNLSLSDCRVAIDALLESILEAENDHSHPLFACTLGKHYLDMGAAIVADRHFESGVLKLQQGEASELTDDQRMACSRLRKTLPQDSSQVTEASNSLVDKIARVRKRARRSSGESYVDSRFILGSVAECERLWSIASHVIGNAKHSMTPLTLETILFLKVNSSYWGPATVRKAMAEQISDRVAEKVAADDVEFDLLSSH